VDGSRIIHDPCQASGGGAQGDGPRAVRYTATGALPGRTRKIVDPLPESFVRM